MDIALSMDYTPTQLQRINCVRIFLGIFYVSELTNPEGDEIDIRIQQFQKHSDCQTTMTRPYQKEPNMRSWVLWERITDFITDLDGVTLKNSLGDYTDCHSKSGLWATYISKDTSTITTRNQARQWIEF